MIPSCTAGQTRPFRCPAPRLTGRKGLPPRHGLGPPRPAVPSLPTSLALLTPAPSVTPQTYGSRPRLALCSGCSFGLESWKSPRECLIRSLASPECSLQHRLLSPKLTSRPHTRSPPTPIPLPCFAFFFVSENTCHFQTLYIIYLCTMLMFTVYQLAPLLERALHDSRGLCCLMYPKCLGWGLACSKPSTNLC